MQYRQPNIIVNTVARRYELDPDSANVGGQGAVYLATDCNLGRKVCIKRMQVPGANDLERNQNAAAMQNEARMLLQLDDLSLHVPQIYDCWYDPGDHYVNIAMQYIKGTSLEALLSHAEAQGRRACDHIRAEQMLGWMVSLCDILCVMEGISLYHKDIKPANLMLDEHRNLWLIDFGISIQAANLVEGTPGYRAPEMEPGSRFTMRSRVDMFAIGVMLYRFYTGKVPAQPEDYATSGLRPTSWSRYRAPMEYNPAMPASVNEIVIKCMAYLPEQRYSSVRELRIALQNASRNVSRGAARNTSKNVSRGAAGNASRNVSRGAAGNASRNVSRDATGGSGRARRR